MLYPTRIGYPIATPEYTSKLPLVIMLTRELVQNTPHPRRETQNLGNQWGQLARPLVVGSLSPPRGTLGQPALQ